MKNENQLFWFPILIWPNLSRVSLGHHFDPNLVPSKLKVRRVTSTGHPSKISFFLYVNLCNFITSVVLLKLYTLPILCWFLHILYFLFFFFGFEVLVIKHVIKCCNIARNLSLFTPKFRFEMINKYLTVTFIKVISETRNQRSWHFTRIITLDLNYYSCYWSYDVQGLFNISTNDTNFWKLQ